MTSRPPIGLGIAAVLLAVLMAGCSGKDNAAAPVAPADPSSANLQGVVVDEAIRPIAAAAVTIDGPETRNATTDAQGRFTFTRLKPGTYIVHAGHPIYSGAQTTVEAVVGVAEPPTIRIQLARLFSQQPFSEAIKFDGFIQCGYDLGFLTSQCVNDYTTILVPGGLAPQLRSAVDTRGYITAVGPGWQVMVFEMLWQPSAQATSQEMRLLVSFLNRTSTDQYILGGGPSPVLLRLEVGKADASANPADAMVPPEGRPDLQAFAVITAAEGQPVGAGFSQRFTVFQHNFYYGIPPADWSFVKGDAPPF